MIFNTNTKRRYKFYIIDTLLYTQPNSKIFLFVLKANILVQIFFIQRGNVIQNEKIHKVGVN